MPQTDGPRASSCTCRCWHPTASQCLHAIDCCHTQAYEHTLWHNTTHTHPTPNGGQRTRTHPSQLSRMRSIAVAAQRRRTVLRRGEHILHVVRERAREHRLLMARLNERSRSIRTCIFSFEPTLSPPRSIVPQQGALPSRQAPCHESRGDNFARACLCVRLSAQTFGDGGRPASSGT
jgi:hypothetical protein